MESMDAVRWSFVVDEFDLLGFKFRREGADMAKSPPTELCEKAAIHVFSVHPQQERPLKMVAGGVLENEKMRIEECDDEIRRADSWVDFRRRTGSSARLYQKKMKLLLFHDIVLLWTRQRVQRRIDEKAVFVEEIVEVVRSVP